MAPNFPARNYTEPELISRTRVGAPVVLMSTNIMQGGDTRISDQAIVTCTPGDPSDLERYSFFTL